MSEEFEWVSHGSPEEEEEAKKKSLPATVKGPVTQLSVKALAKLALRSITFAGIVILALIARVLLMILRLKLPSIKIPPKIKLFAKQLYLLCRSLFYWSLSKLSALNIRKPEWLRLPAINYRPLIAKIPYGTIRPILSGLSFLFILVGIGAIFSLFEEGLSISNQISLLLGTLGLFWFIWDSHARSVIARFLLKIVQMRNSKR